MVHETVSLLYSIQPNSTLYHYTSLSGLMGMVEKRNFWASDIRYLNDSEELNHIESWLYGEIIERLQQSNTFQKVLLQFHEWLRERLNYGPMVFVGCFTENGNLLSQWRGYCPHGQGVSIGFNPTKLVKRASLNSFAIGKCIYDKDTKSGLAKKVIDAVISASQKNGESENYHPSQSYHAVFAEMELQLFRIAALIKAESFKEEAEWRLVSQPLSSFVEPKLKFREGLSMLIPYMELPLSDHNKKIEMEHVFVGPTPTMNLSIDSVRRYLSREAVCPTIYNCGIPYRG